MIRKEDIKNGEIVVDKIDIDKDISFNNFKITNLADPINNKDAVNKQYVDNNLAGLNWQKSVINVIAESSLPTNPSIGNRYLLNSGTNINKIVEWDGSQWVYYSPSANWALFDNTNDQGWTYNPESADSFKWLQFTGTGMITAGTGLSKIGNTLNVNLGAGITELPTDEIGIDLDTNSGLELSSLDTSGKLRLTNTGVTPGTYRSVTVDVKGRVTAGTNPTTFVGYGISDTSANLAAAITDKTGTGKLVFSDSPTFTGDIYFPSGKLSSFGNLALGTYNPGQRLTVSGDISIINGGGIRYEDTAPVNNILVGDGTRFVSTTPGSLTKTDDTNVTLALGGTPNAALLKSVSLTLGWTGTLAISRGGTGLSSLGIANQLLGVNSGATALEYKNISSLLTAGSGINITGTTNATIANTGVLSLNSSTGSLTLQGTTNQVNVSTVGSTITLSTPQNIHTGATPTFSALNLSSLTLGSILFAGSSGSISQDNTNLFWDNTNKRLGIGTVSPGSKLAVSGNAVIGSGYATSAGPTDGLAIQGNVGIGTTSPSEKVDVVGNIKTNSSVIINPTPNNTTASGTIINATAGENLSTGDVCYLKSDGKYWKANATSSSTMPACVMATQAISANTTGKFLIQGYWKNTGLSLTVGGLIYMSTTAGGITQTAPNATGNQIQVLGYATALDTIYFNPNLMLLEVA